MANKKFELLDVSSGKKTDLPVRAGTIGPDVIDIASLNKDHGVFTFDPGFMATASTESKITYIDGDAGVLMYRGYPIEQLAAHSSFIEVAYLLLNGELPDTKQLGRDQSQWHPKGQQAGDHGLAKGANAADEHCFHLSQRYWGNRVRSKLRRSTSPIEIPTGRSPVKAVPVMRL